MSHRSVSPALHIARKNQSAPKQHWAEKEIQIAAEEIDSGRYVPDTSAEGALNGLGLALSTGSTGMAVGQQPDFETFHRQAIETRDLDQIGRHPRVVAALERLKREVEEIKNPQELYEKQWQMHELNELKAKGNQWDGQERWKGKNAKEQQEIEEMRIGRILTPQAFHAELEKVIGRGRVLLSPHAVKENPDDKSARCGLYVPNPRWQGSKSVQTEYAATKAGELRAEGEKKLTQAKQLRVQGFHTLADRKFQEAGNLAQAATTLLMEASTDIQLAEPELLRVGTLQWPCGSEWMVMRFDRYGVPTTAKYIGWRTALLTMVRCQAITEEEAHKAFPVGSGKAGNWYLEQLFMLRNAGDTVQ